MPESFISNLQTVAVQVIVLYLIASVGFIADKTKIFVKADATRRVDLLFNMILPVAIINSFLSLERTREHIIGIFVSLFLAFLTHFVAIIISTFCFRKRDKKEQGIYHYAMVFSNAAFLSLPLAQSVVGDEGVFYSSCYVAAFNVLAFTYGIKKISGGEAEIKLKHLIFNPGSISVLIGFPVFLSTTLDRIGACNSPMAMIVFGTFFANCNFKNIFAKKEVYFVSFVRLFLIPVIMLFVFKLFRIEGSMLVALTISACAPVATNTAMYAAKYDNDTALSSELVGQTSIFSVITMPVIVALAQLI